ncbi:MAG TPA: O-antigen ligase family protein [Opitutaceae bacterium]|nr:O-antigen ligase family protein [Opitutaceae bacterium]
MEGTAAISPPLPDLHPGPDVPARVREAFVSTSAWVSFLAGALTAYTISVVGEMPVGEILLVAAAAWAVLCVVFNRAWPGPLLRRPGCRHLLAAQAVALVAYVVSDLYRHSAPRDMARGWARMVFLAIDVVAVAYLFGRSPRNFVIFLLGQCAGDFAHAIMPGPMFGDLWKFGVGAPLTCLVFLLAGRGGPKVAALAAFAIGAVHFRLDYRSYGGVCVLAGMLALLQACHPRFRVWLAPLALSVVAAALIVVYDRGREADRATRSEIERSAMVTAALEAVGESPLIGHGSWFSNSNVYENFMLIRHVAAKEARVGGFADPRRETDTMALHSQLLVALAEGGLFGGAFFLLFGAGLVRTLARLVFVQPWHALAPVATLVLLSALWNLLFSPFSGAHRVYIAVACGLILLLPRFDAPRFIPVAAGRNPMGYTPREMETQPDAP